MSPPHEGTLCGELIKMLEDLAPARAFIRTPTEEGFSFEMLNTLLTMDRGQESFSRHPVLWKTVNTWEEEEKKKTVCDDRWQAQSSVL